MPDQDGNEPEIDVDALPSTLQRSDEKAQRTYAATLQSAEESYGDGERAHRTAFASLKHSYEKVGDHWEPKDHKGPSDDKAAGGADTSAETAGGVDAKASKRHLYEIATRLGVSGRSSMTKDQLVEAIGRATTGRLAGHAPPSGVVFGDVRAASGQAAPLPQPEAVGSGPA